MADKGYWVIRTYEAGPIGEKTKYWVSGDRGRRNRKRELDAVKKQEQNEYSVIKRLARHINANFRAEQNGALFGLDYSDEALAKIMKRADENKRSDGESLRWEAEHELRLYLRRVKRECEKRGIEFKYIAITSDMDGATGEVKRIHHHIITTAEVYEILKEKWKHGEVYRSKMKRQADYTAVSEYLVRQVRRIPDAKKYMTSRNLIRVLPKDRVAVSDCELHVPAKGKLLFRTEYSPGLPQYIRYILPPKKLREAGYEEEIE